MPKSLATVQFSPTPPEGTGAVASPEVPLATATPELVEPTQTPTPYVGVFSGTEVDGTPAAAIAPLSGNTTIGGTGGQSGASNPVNTGPCSIAIAGTFLTPYEENASLPERLGCPRDAGQSLNLVFQPFQSGKMFWHSSRARSTCCRAMVRW
ncbi:MAG: hypothetical protein GYB66_06865 [Chloroflexi bacterium]|nr:hypothetical protein [Chloroflexota bacterium]